MPQSTDKQQKTKEFIFFLRNSPHIPLILRRRLLYKNGKYGLKLPGSTALLPLEKSLTIFLQSSSRTLTHIKETEELNIWKCETRQRLYTTKKNAIFP